MIDEQKDWRDYERCKRFLEGKGFYSRNDTCYKFFEGDQWGEKQPDGQPFPQLNVIKQQVEYKVATVMQNGFSLNFSNAEYRDSNLGKFIEVVASKMNSFMAKTWEHAEMDTRIWEDCTDACISGGVGCYSYIDDEGHIKVEAKNNTDVLFADEQQGDIQKQKFIILPFRRMVSEVREEAVANGMSEDEARQILPDNETQNQVGNYTKTEVAEEDIEDGGKCLCILKMWKDKDGFVHFRKSTATKVFVKETKTNMRLYPVAFMPWNLIKGAARGKGDVAEWIPNQVSINKNLARRDVAIAMGAYPKMVYDTSQVDNPQDLVKIGAVIGVNGGYGGDIQKMVGYIQPQQIAPDAANYVTELIERTQEMSGASSYALGNIDPSKTSGRAILAVRDASAVPLNMQVARVKKYVEDIGKVWWELLASSNPDGLSVEYEATVMDEQGNESKEMVVEVIPPAVLPKIKFNINVSVSSANVFSKYAIEQTLETLFTGGMITFDEYVESLPEDSAMPKQKMQKIVEARATLQRLTEERDIYKQKYEEVSKAIYEASGVGRKMLVEMLGNNAKAEDTAPTAKSREQKTAQV